MEKEYCMITTTFDNKKEAEKKDKEAEEEKLEVTVTIDKTGINQVELLSDKGTNTKGKIYTDYAIEAGKSNKPGEWYSYESNGKRCLIKIDNAKVPKGNGTIEIPLANCGGKKFVIRVKHKVK